jgi:hypothetical protein
LNAKEFVETLDRWHHQRIQVHCRDHQGGKEVVPWHWELAMVGVAKSLVMQQQWLQHTKWQVRVVAAAALLSQSRQFGYSSMTRF